MKENRIILITMVLNFVVFIIKFVAGITFSFSTLIADSIQSFIDFVTDIMSLFANKVGKRRANKNYPFGYGQVYYLANLFTGLLLFLIGIFICFQFFTFEGQLKFDSTLFIILIVILILKSIVVAILNKYSKKYKSELMIESVKESETDFISTCVVLSLVILSLFGEYIPSFINLDRLGSLGMAVYVFYTSIKMIISNIRGILMNDEENSEIRKQIIEEINNFNELELKSVKVIKMSSYYSIFLQISPNNNLTIKRYLFIEKKLKKQLKLKNKLIRFIDIEPI